MKYLLKIFIFSTLLICVNQIFAQVTGVQYAIDYNSDAKLFDCYLYILEGDASTVQERVQFNAQYSVIVPKGTKVNVDHSNMPLVYNQNFEGTQPMEWAISSQIKSPIIIPEVDIYGITPSLAPAGFYNILSKEDLIRLFSLRIEGENVNLNNVRLFNNDHDPKSNELGMQNGDFSNGFTIGGFSQVYRGIKNINQGETNLFTLEDKNK